LTQSNASPTQDNKGFNVGTVGKADLVFSTQNVPRMWIYGTQTGNIAGATIIAGCVSFLPTVPSVQVTSGVPVQWNGDAGISRLAADSLAIGNGTQGDFSGSLKLTGLNVQGHISETADVAGQVTITASNTTQAVTFSTAYLGTGQPIVLLTPTSDPLALGVPVGYWVTYQGSAGAWTGFTANIQAALVGNVTFNYCVFQNR
jgi:hypothetical protein